MSIRVSRSFSKFLVFSLFAAGACLAGYAGDLPKEMEDPKGKVQKKIAVDDDSVVSSRPKPAETFLEIPPDVRLDEVSRAVDRASSPALRELLSRYIVPFDRVSESGGAINVKPLAYRKSEWKGLEAVQLTPLDSSGKPKEPQTVKVSEIKNVEPFETLILAEADKLQKKKLDGTKELDQLAAAEVLLSAALRFHDYSRTSRKVDGIPRNLRRGETWDEIRKPLAANLRLVRLDYLNALAGSGDQNRLRELVARLVIAYPRDAEMSKTISAFQLKEAERLVSAGNDQDLINARKILEDLELNFPGTGGDLAKKIRDKIRAAAATALKRCQEKAALPDEQTARYELARAIAIDPDLDGIREMQQKLQVDYPILYVGVKHYPVYMSPATARLDSERHAAELMFEGLLEEVPDSTGAVRYRTGAALSMPIAFPGGREFTLRTFDRDSAGRSGFASHDVVGTVSMMRTQLGTWNSYPLTWLAPEPPSPRDDRTVRINFGLSHPDPRSALTFKVLPARWLAEHGKTIEDVLFAEKPFGTGPFTLYSNSKPLGNAAREMVFVNNPAYGRWPDRSGLPPLREIRFVEASKMDPKQAFLEGKLHILPDIPTADIDKYSDANSGLKTKVEVVTATTNRRVYILAINLRKPNLQNKLLRQGLSYAIDREEILRKFYRAGRPEAHKVMTGPFPPGTWAVASGPAGPTSLTDPDKATGRLKAYLADPGLTNTIELSYPDDDPRAVQVCDEIKREIESLFKNEPATARRMQIDLVKKPLKDLLVNVQDEHSNFQLAYVPFDYPDDWYPYALGAALDRTAVGFRGRNWFNFLSGDTNPDEGDQELGRALAKIRGYRDFTEITGQTTLISKLFNESLPFIPLWQLDRHMVVSRRVKIMVDDSNEVINARYLNPNILFQGVGRWRLE